MISASLAPSSVSAPAAERGRLGFGLTRRALLLFLAGTVWLVPGFFVPKIAWGMAAWDVVLFLAVILDARRLPAPGKIVVERVWRNAPALANETEIEICLTQQGAMRLYCCYRRPHRRARRVSAYRRSRPQPQRPIQNALLFHSTPTWQSLYWQSLSPLSYREPWSGALGLC